MRRWLNLFASSSVACAANKSGRDAAAQHLTAFP